MRRKRRKRDDSTTPERIQALRDVQGARGVRIVP